MRKLMNKLEHKRQSKFHPRIAHEDPEGRRCITVLFM